MNRTIEFETIVEDGIIRIPKEYAGAAFDIAKVTLIPMNAKIKLKRKRGTLSPDDFTALNIDTRNWHFDRDEANTRG